MFSKETCLKRFTPPTCTLEIWAKPSTWLRSSNYQRNLRFELHFDAPTLSDSEQVTVIGQKSELELFSEIVLDYVQQFLGTSMTRQSKGFSKPFTNKLVKITNRGLLSHELSLENLNSSQPSVTLNASQLFDLVNALEQYQTEEETLLNKSSQDKRQLVIKAGLSGIILALSASGLYWWQTTQGKSNFSGPIIQQKHQPSNFLPVIPPTTSLPNSKLPVPAPVVPSDLAKLTTVSSIPKVVIPSPSPTLILQPSTTTNVPVVPSPTPKTITVSPTSSEETAIQLPPPANNIEPSVVPSPSIISPSIKPLARINNKSQPPDLLDLIPQVQEVREYFQQHWKVPDGLKQTLEYRLQINSQGSLTRVIPLGRAANIYLDRTSMPLLNKPFVSPLSTKEPVTIRLVFLTNGTVKTFLE